MSSADPQQEDKQPLLQEETSGRAPPVTAVSGEQATAELSSESPEG